MIEISASVFVAVFAAVDVVGVAVMSCVADCNTDDELVLFEVAVERELGVEFATGMTLTGESPRTVPGLAALAIPSSSESTTNSATTASSKDQFGLRVLCDAPDVAASGDGSGVEGGT